MINSHGIIYDKKSLDDIFKKDVYKMILPEIREFIYSHEIHELIDENNWERIFDLFRKRTYMKACILVAILLASDIDFMPYISSIPKYFLPIGVKSIRIPSNIKNIHKKAFEGKFSDNVILLYEGSVDDWINNVKIFEDDGTIYIGTDIQGVKKVEFID